MQTTLLNHILTSQHGKRIAVIENEVWILLLTNLHAFGYFFNYLFSYEKLLITLVLALKDK
jgi:hypothetical protein